jgi:hypothetical protein
MDPRAWVLSYSLHLVQGSTTIPLTFSTVVHMTVCFKLYFSKIELDTIEGERRRYFIGFRLNIKRKRIISFKIIRINI